MIQLTQLWTGIVQLIQVGATSGIAGIVCILLVVIIMLFLYYKLYKLGVGFIQRGNDARTDAAQALNPLQNKTDEASQADAEKALEDQIKKGS